MRERRFWEWREWRCFKERRVSEELVSWEKGGSEVEEQEEEGGAAGEELGRVWVRVEKEWDQD